MRNLYKILLMHLLLFCVGCVHEDRSGCPCYLCFAHDGFDFNGYSRPLRVCVFNEGRTALRNEYTRVQLEQDIADVPSPRLAVDVACLGGVKGMTMKEGSTVLTIPLGKECDSLYISNDRVLALGERAKVYGVIHKQYSRVRINFNSSEDFKGTYAVRVIGNTSGIDVMTNSPVEGRFEYVPFDMGGSMFSFNLPRQFDDSLILELWGAEEKEQVSGSIPEDRFKLYQTMELGRYITEELSYDWKAEDLPDIDIFVDYGRMEITISIDEWDVVVLYPIEF